MLSEQPSMLMGEVLLTLSCWPAWLSEAKTLIPRSISGSYSLESGERERLGLTLMLSKGLTLMLPKLSLLSVLLGRTLMPSSLVTLEEGGLNTGGRAAFEKMLPLPPAGFCLELPDTCR